MKFVYSYRDATGAKVEEELEAENRADCFEKIKQLGRTPISVTVAAERPAKAASNFKLPPNFFFVVGAVLIVLGVVAYFVLGDSTKASAPEAPAEKTPAKKESAVPVARPVSEKPLEKQEARATETALPARRRGQKRPLPTSNIYTNSRGEEVRVAKDGTRTAMLTAWARKREEEKKNPPKRIFRHTSEAYMAMFLNPASPVPPPPENYTEEHIKAMLANEIVIDPENDTPDEIRQKEGVIEMKQELVKWLEDGGSFDSFLGALQKQQNEEASKMFEARRMITEAMEKGNIEEARAMYDEINQYFAEEHMPPVNVAPKYRKVLNNRE